jgi:hypothetical protein
VVDRTRVRYDSIHVAVRLSTDRDRTRRSSVAPPNVDDDPTDPSEH